MNFSGNMKNMQMKVLQKNCELYRSFDLCEWYKLRLSITSLEEFQECDSEWRLSCILNLTINTNKHNPLGCYIEL